MPLLTAPGADGAAPGQAADQVSDQGVSPRDVGGFAQHLQEGRWVFHVTGFDDTCSGQAGRCRVLRMDGTSDWVPIDAHDRIEIAGRRYGRGEWVH